MIIKFASILLFIIWNINKISYARNTSKEAIFIILGAGGRIDQEHNSYANDLNEEGYKIIIYSFDPKYSNDSHSENTKLIANIKEYFDKIEDYKNEENDINNKKSTINLKI
jgi:hypothetical protein